MYTTLTSAVFCRVTNKAMILMNLFTVQGHIGPMLETLLSLDSDDLPCHYAPDPLCQCGVLARQGMVPPELGYGFFCGNIVGEDDAWVSSY
jgi:hypothetical protein